MLRPSLAALVVLSLGCGSPAPAHAPSPATTPSIPTAADPLDAPLPLDSRITKGTLASGLTYYVLPHRKPEGRAQIWLAVNAGAVLEDDDQRGLAHFVEHMGFNGTRRFPKASLVDFIEKSGVRFGADLNASTAFDQTVYTLQVPTDRAELLAKGLTVLRDWSDGVTFDPEEVEKERGVVLEEWRLGRGAGMRIFDKQAPVVFHGSRYAERLPIGKPEIIKGASRDAIQRFYKDWYRPDLMAVIAVGDFDAKAMEQNIKAEFATLATARSPRPKPKITIPPHDEPLVSIETDPEQPVTSVGILTEFPHRPEKTGRDYRRILTERLFNAMFNARLDELRRQADAPFLGAGAGVSAMVRAADIFQQTAFLREDGVERGFGALLEEVLRVERHGFTATELARTKGELLRQYQQGVKEYDKRDSSDYAAEIVRNFLLEETMPGPERELALVEQLLPGITLEEENKLATTLGQGSRVITVSGPSKMQKPTTQKLLALGKEAAARDIRPYEDAVASGPLMKEKPAPGTIVDNRAVPEIGVTVWTLGNGARVVLKPTTFANDEIRMSAFSPGGTSLVKDADYPSAEFAGEIIGQSGLGPYDAVRLRKALTGKLVSVNGGVGELEETLGGRAATADVETMFQMMHLAFTAPRRDETAFASWKARQIELTKHQRAMPEMAFADEMMRFEWQNHPRRLLPRPETFEQVSLDRAFAIYTDRFADAGDFTFVFVGNIDPAKLRPLVEQYLASLPSKGRKETWKDVKASLVPGVRRKTFASGSEPKSRVEIVFHGAEAWTRDTENDMRMLTEVLQMRLREVLREDMGGVYGVSVSGSIARRPRPEYRVSVRFGCAPENVDKLEKAVLAETAAIADRGIGDDTLAKVKELRRRAHETDLKDNGYWLRELETAYRYGDDPKLILDDAPMIAKVSSDRVRAAAKRYVSRKQYFVGVLNPEK